MSTTYTYLSGFYGSLSITPIKTNWEFPVITDALEKIHITTISLNLNLDNNVLISANNFTLTNSIYNFKT